MLTFTNPDEAARLLERAQQDVHQRWALYQDMSSRFAVRGSQFDRTEAAKGEEKDSLTMETP